MKKPKLSNVLKEELELQSGDKKGKHTAAIAVMTLLGFVFIVMIAKAYFMKNDIVSNEENKTSEQKIEGQPEIKDEPNPKDVQSTKDEKPKENPQPKKKEDTSPGYTVYTIQEGDTLSEVANVNGMTSSQLMKYNGIKDPESIKPGQKVKIPK